MYLLGNLTGQTPKKHRATQSRSDLKDLKVYCSFLVETEQHEVDPDGNGAEEMVTDERFLAMRMVATVKQLSGNVDIEPEEGNSECP